MRPNGAAHPTGLLTATPGRTRVPTGNDEPPINERRPPRETRTKLGRTTKSGPELTRHCDAPEIEPGDARLQPRPPDTHQEVTSPTEVPNPTTNH